MAYGSKRSLKKKFNKKTRYSKSAKGNAYKLDKKIKNLSKKINGDIETKNYYVSLSDTAMIQDIGASTSLSALNLNVISQGLNSYNRIGLEITATSIDFRWQLVTDAWGGFPLMLHYRVIMFRTKEGYGSAPAIGDILQTVTNGYFMNAPYSTPNVGTNVRILYDKIHTIDSLGGVKGFTGHIKKKLSHKIKYVGTTGAIDTQLTGGLWVMFFCNSTSAGYPRYRYTSRINYKDA